MLLRLAWRNLWRNPRRTGLTAAAGVFAVVLTLYSVAIATGSHELMIDMAVRLYPGHVEASLAGYRDNRTLDYSMILPEQAEAEFDALPGLLGWSPRLESWALAIPDRDESIGRAAWLIGIDPARESGVSRIEESVVQGRFLEDARPTGILLGETLASNLGVEVGDSLILLAGDYYGSQSADRFHVTGLLHVGDDQFDRYAALVGLETLQEFLVVPGGVSHVAFFASDSGYTERIRTRVAELLAIGDHEILAWPELIPDIVQFMILDDLSLYIILAIIIVVVAFGLLNTILMSVFERVREFGVMRALGVRPRKVFGLVLIESALISALGIAVGLLIALPGLWWVAENPMQMPGGEEMREAVEMFGIEPVMMFRLTARQVVTITGVLIVVSVISALPPALRACRGRPVDALREV